MYVIQDVCIHTCLKDDTHIVMFRKAPALHAHV